MTTIPAEFIVQRDGRSFVLYAGLLSLAHQQGLKAIDTELLQIPHASNGNVAICRAVVTTERGTFSGLGDASPDNVTRMMVQHIIRMAETRAKARALRDAVNVGATALEELGDTGEPGPEEEAPQQARSRPVPPQQPATRPPRQDNPDAATPAQLSAIFAIGRREMKWDDDETEKAAQRIYHKRVGELTKREASGFIESLKAGETRAAGRN